MAPVTTGPPKSDGSPSAASSKAPATLSGGSGDVSGRVAKSLRLTGPGRVIGRGLQFVIQLMLGRFLGPYGYGLYSLAFSIVEVAKQFGLLGLQNGVVKIGAVHVSDEDDSAIRGCARATYQITMVSSVALAVALWFLAEPLAVSGLRQPALVWPLRIFAASMPFDAWLILSQFWSRAVQRVHIDVLLADIVQPIATILGVSVALALGTGLLGAVVGYGFACALGAGLGVALLLRALPKPPPGGSVPYDLRPVLRMSVPMLLVGFSYTLMGHVDKMMIGALAGAESVGVYTAAFRLSRQVGLIQTAFVPMFAPLVSGLHHRNDLTELNQLYQRASRWILISSLPVVLLLIVFGDVPLALFGTAFTSAWPLLVILTIGQFINLTGGLAMQVLQMVGRQDDDLAIIVLGLLANVGLNLVLIRAHGAVGAALATSLAFAGLSLARLWVVRKRMGLWPYTRECVPPMIVAGLAGLVGYAVRGLGAGWVWIVGTLCLTLALYAAGVWRYGLQAEDRAQVIALLARRR